LGSMPKTLRLTGQCIKHAEKHHPNHYPTKPLNYWVVAELNEWHVFRGFRGQLDMM
jgi:hypothetical protein